ncbi:MAG: PEP-CTERM sorting domain-containing protein [Lentisphaeria bacterium]
MKIPTVIHASAAIALLTAGAAMADVLRTVTTTNYARERASGTGIGVVCDQVVAGNSFTAWVAAENAEYRVVYDFRLDDLGITAANVTSATLKFTTAPWQAGRNAVTVDQVASDLHVWGNEMYATSLAAVKSNGWVSGTYTVDITAIFKAALASASSTQGLALRFYNDNDADPTAPWNGTTVGFDTGYNISNVSIEVVPEPAALGLLALGSLVLLRRRR